ncbi:uncharacterized protein [Argopecten irradians]
MASLYICVLMLGNLGMAVAYARMYEKCVKYCDMEPVEVAGVSKVCVKGWVGDCMYCKYFAENCPEVQECKDSKPPIPSRDNRCLICPGDDCVYQGQIYFEQEMFDSIDGVNKCMCMRGGEIKCEKHYLGSEMTFCS